MSIVPNPSELDRLSPLFVFGPDSMNSNKIKTSSEYIEILLVTSFHSSIRDPQTKTGLTQIFLRCSNGRSGDGQIELSTAARFDFLKLKYHYFDEENLVAIRKVDI